METGVPTFSRAVRWITLSDRDTDSPHPSVKLSFTRAERGVSSLGLPAVLILRVRGPSSSPSTERDLIQADAASASVA